MIELRIGLIELRVGLIELGIGLRIHILLGIGLIELGIGLMELGIVLRMITPGAPSWPVYPALFFFFFKLKKKDWIHGCQEKNRIFCGRVLVWIRGLHAPAHLSATSHVSCLWCYFLTQSLQDITLRPTDAKQTYRQTQNRPTEGQSD